MKGSRHLVAVAGAFALAASLTAGLATSSAAATVEEGTLGGPLHAEMYPSGLETAPDGTVVIADTGNNRVAKYNQNGTLVWETGTHGAGTNQFDNPRDIGIDGAGNIYVADTRNSRIVKLSSAGAWLGSTTGPSTAFSFPLGVSAKGNKVYVGDTGRHRVVVLDQALAVTQTVVANGECTNINDNRDAQADAAGNIYVAGYKTNEILKFAPDGTCLDKWGGTGTTNGKFRTPYGVDTGIDPVTGEELDLRRRRTEQPGAGLRPRRQLRHPVRHLRRARPGGHVHHHAARGPGQGRDRQRVVRRPVGQPDRALGPQRRAASPTTAPSVR